MKTSLQNFIEKLWVAAVLFSAAAFSASAQKAAVYSPVIPVIADRDYNIVAEICIEADGQTSTAERVELNLEGINLDAVTSVGLVYSGTMSVIRSRTDSYVLIDAGKKLGGGQGIWCDEDFVMPLTSVHPSAPHIGLPLSQPLVKGDNYFYLTMKVDASRVSDFSKAFSMDVTKLVVDGKEIEFSADGSNMHRLGSKVRQHGDDGVEHYRIPGLVTTHAGTLVAVYDVRHDSSLDLQSNVDIGVSRSTDGGRTWEDMIIAMDMGTWGHLPEGQNGIGDPAILVDEQTGDLFIMAVWTHGISANRAWTSVGQGMTPYETGQLMVVRSSDDGKTWSAPYNITAQVKDPEWYLTLQGPGRGISMKDGTLVFAIQHIGKDRIPSAGIVYSQDHGKTWHCHESAHSNTTEAQVVEIEPGVLMLNMRDNRKTGRAVYTTADMGKTWTIHPSSGHLIEPVCMGSLLKVDAKDNCTGRDLLIFSNPATTKGRNHMTIKVSLDQGYTWLEENSLLIDQEENWGYSCLTMIDEETVGILYECSTVQLGFQAVKLADLIQDYQGTLPLSPLPSVQDGPVGYGQGVSAPFCALSGKTLFLAGGANFPGVPAAQNGQKAFYQEIYSLDLQDGDSWKQSGKLPEPMAYGASYMTRQGWVVAGGNNGQTSAHVYLLKGGKDGFHATKLPDLPEPVEQAGFVSCGSELYLAGGLNNGKPVRSVYVCNLKSSDRQWKKVAELPQASVQPVLCTKGNALYCWCGYNPETGSAEGRGYRLDLKKRVWTEIAPAPGNTTMTGTAAIGYKGKFYFAGGVDRALFEKALTLEGKEKQAYLTLPPSRYHFQNRIRIYDPSSDSWELSPVSGKLALAGAGAVCGKQAIYILGGEIKPGIRTNKNWKIELK